MAVDGSNSETSQSNSAEEISVGDMMGVAASTAAGERAGTSKSDSVIQEMIVNHADNWHYKIYFI